jgi:hypothetical protein
MRYMRIPQNKFWGWVVASVLVGLGIGLIIMLVSGAATNDKLRVLQNRLNASAGTSSTADVQTQLASAEASIAALTAQNAQLTADLAAANATIATLKGSSASTTSSGTISFIARTVAPSSVSTTGTMTLTVRVKGHPTKVTVRVVSHTSGVTFDHTYTLKRIIKQTTAERWQIKVSAPTRKGTYRYAATAFIGTRSFVMGGIQSFTAR